MKDGSELEMVRGFIAGIVATIRTLQIRTIIRYRANWLLVTLPIAF